MNYTNQKPYYKHRYWDFIQSYWTRGRDINEHRLFTKWDLQHIKKMDKLKIPKDALIWDIVHSKWWIKKVVGTNKAGKLVIIDYPDQRGF